VPHGTRLVLQPAHNPQLQPTEYLWAFVDEPLVNRYFETIEDLDLLVGERCVALTRQQEMMRDSTLFHWWPRPRPRRNPGTDHAEIVSCRAADALLRGRHACVP
jgi:hypothetical protein